MRARQVISAAVMGASLAVALTTILGSVSVPGPQLPTAVTVESRATTQAQQAPTKATKAGASPSPLSLLPIALAWAAGLAAYGALRRILS